MCIVSRFVAIILDSFDTAKKMLELEEDAGLITLGKEFSVILVDMLFYHFLFK